MKVEVDVLGSPSLTVLIMVSERKGTSNLAPLLRVKLCESRGGRPGLSADSLLSYIYILSPAPPTLLSFNILSPAQPTLS